MTDRQKISEAQVSGMNMVEHHEQKLSWKGVGSERSEITRKLAEALEAELPNGLVVEHRAADGTLKGRDVFTATDLMNALTDEGANYLFNVFFGATAKPAGWYMGLTTAAPSAGSTLATISECTAGNQPGYARSGAITWNFGTNRHAQTGNRVFTATGAWVAGATHLFLCTSASGTTGTLFNYLALSATRQPAANGDTITVSWDGSL